VGRIGLALLFVALTLAFAGCDSVRQARRPPNNPPAPPAANLPSTVIDYVDTDGFDVLFEASLVNGDAVIHVRTANEKPDWTGRLNGWIAAWNMGKAADVRRFRGQIPVATIDGETLREFRLLVGAVIDRADDASKAGAMWFKEERVRSRRVELLKPYNLRFHVNDDNKISLIFFHGDYARHYSQHVASLTERPEADPWRRGLEFSSCKKMRQTLRSPQSTNEQATISFSEITDK
jgi:hypothetical protein